MEGSFSQIQSQLYIYENICTDQYRCMHQLIWSPCIHTLSVIYGYNLMWPDLIFAETFASDDNSD